jgi:putative membrane protein
MQKTAKRLWPVLGLLAAWILAAACNNSNPDNVKTAESANVKRDDSLQNKVSVTDSGRTGIPSKFDADFMVKATAGNQLEVILGKLAQENGVNAGVKRFGEMMVHDHTKGEEELRGLGASKRIILPDTISNQQKKEQQDLGKKKGRDFDKAYVKLMVEDHKEDVDEFRKASQEANDPDIKAIAGKMLPILQMHLDSAQALQKSMK